jgi:uncharacterized protein (DUF924 family)
VALAFVIKANNMNYSSKDIIHFWFEEIDSKLWFNSTPELDAEIKARFEVLFHAALNNELSKWQDTVEGCLALIIILDQFPLNMYRGKSESFAGEAKAIETAKIAVEKGFDQMLEKKHSQNIIGISSGTMGVFLIATKFWVARAHRQNLPIWRQTKHFWGNGI